MESESHTESSTLISNGIEEGIDESSSGIIMPSYHVGIDLGNNSIVVASVDVNCPGIVTLETNSLANRSTPTVVGFNRNIRCIGEEADAGAISNPSNTITNLLQLMRVDGEEKLKGVRERHKYRWRHSPMLTAGKDGTPAFVTIPVKFNEERYSITPEHALSVLLRRLCGLVIKNREGQDLEEVEEGAGGLLDKLDVYLAVPSQSSEREIISLLKAAELAGLKRVKCVSQGTALAQQWAMKNQPDFYRECQPLSEEKRPAEVYVGIVDIGYSQTAVEILRLSEKAGGDGVEVRIVAEEVDRELGTNEFVNALAEHILKKLRSQKSTSPSLYDFDLSTKKALRFINSCEKLMCELSALPDSSIDIEAFTDKDDMYVPVTRESFEQACEQHKARLDAIMGRCISHLRSSFPDCPGLSGLDIVGGATRIPWVQQALCKSLEGFTVLPPAVADAIASSEDPAAALAVGLLRRTLDGSSAIACGAVLLPGVVGIPAVEVDPTLDRPVEKDITSETLEGIREDVREASALEATMAAIEKTENLRLSMRNDLETCILNMQSALQDPKNSKLVEAPKAKEVLDAADQWFCDRSYPDDTSCAVYEEVLQNLRRDLAEPFKGYFEKQENDRRQLEEELKKKANENAGGREDDPDVKIPPSQCIKRALKNKEEGTEMFKGGSVELAARRYVRALQFTAKLHDAAPQYKAEGNSISLSCYLNLAQCYLKLNTETTFKKAVAACDSALEIEEKNAKALYRKCSALEKLKDYDAAQSVIKECLAVTPDDQDVVKAAERIENHLKQQTEKSKKMYAKMFS